MQLYITISVKHIKHIHSRKKIYPSKSSGLYRIYKPLERYIVGSYLVVHNNKINSMKCYIENVHWLCCRCRHRRRRPFMFIDVYFSFRLWHNEASRFVAWDRFELCKTEMILSHGINILYWGLCFVFDVNNRGSTKTDTQVSYSMMVFFFYFISVDIAFDLPFLCMSNMRCSAISAR